MMSKILTDFLTTIATDAKLRKDFAKDADKTMKKAGLTDEEIQLIKNKNRNELATRIGDGYDIAANSINGIIDVFKIDK